MEVVNFAEILPDNEKTAAILKKRAEDEEIRRQKLEELKALEEKKEKSRKLKEKNEQADRARKEKLLKEANEQKSKEEEANKKLEGKMVVMLEALQQNTTPFEYNCTGLDLSSVKCGILARNIAYNKSLLSIDMSRKGFTDLDGQQLAKMLYTNSTLRKLDLEGNLLGPKSAIEFGEALKHNKSIKSLNLESNQLTVDG